MIKFEIHITEINLVIQKIMFIIEKLKIKEIFKDAANEVLDVV